MVTAPASHTSNSDVYLSTNILHNTTFATITNPSFGKLSTDSLTNLAITLDEAVKTSCPKHIAHNIAESLSTRPGAATTEVLESIFQNLPRLVVEEISVLFSSDNSIPTNTWVCFLAKDILYKITTAIEIAHNLVSLANATSNISFTTRKGHQ